MTKQFLYIIDPLASLDVKTDTTLAIMEEAGRRGIKNFVCEIQDILLRDGQVHFWSAPVELSPGYQNPPAYLAAKTTKSANNFAAIFMRKDPPVDEKFLAALLMLRCHDSQKTVMINQPEGLLIANEKLFGLKIASHCFPPTIVASNKDLLLDFALQHGRVVLKPLYGAGGFGVLVMEKGDGNLMSALGLLTASFSRPVIIQSFIENARLGDKRIIVLGGKAIGAIMRMPSPHDHRANFHAGGSPIPAEITERDLAIVKAIEPSLLELGLHLVGIDVIGGYLTEINVTSPTCIIEIERISQQPKERPLRAQIVDYVEKLIA